MRTRLADYVLKGGAFADGEVMMASSDPLAVVGFMKIGPRECGTLHDAPVLRVVFLR